MHQLVGGEGATTVRMSTGGNNAAVARQLAERDQAVASRPPEGLPLGIHW